MIDAAAQHARHEAEVGGYVAADAAAPVLDAGRAAIGALTGLSGEDVVFTTGSGNALDLLLDSWADERTLACLPGEYGPNLAIMAANGFQIAALPADGDGRVVVDDAERQLAADPPALVHLTALASHRGVAQPLAALTDGLPQSRPAVGGRRRAGLGSPRLRGRVPSAIYSSSRKWMAGPRGVGFLAIQPELAQRLRPRIPPPDWELGLSVLERLEEGEANVAARIGYSLALGEHLAAGPAAIRGRLAELGRLTRTVLAGVDGWRVVEPLDEPTAITTLAPVGGADPQRVRAWLIAERAIVTTSAPVLRGAVRDGRPRAARIAPRRQHRG